ncbi:MAG: DoxX family protein [Gemmatimonadota bacterium]
MSTAAQAHEVLVTTTTRVRAPARAQGRSSSRQRVTGLILTGIAILFLLFDSIVKFSGIPAVTESMTQLGYPIDSAVVIGTIELVCIAIYLIPRTSVLGAVLLTGYFGGAIATHVRVGNPLFSHILFPTYIAALIWIGLYLRDARLRALVAPTTPRD